MLRLAHGKRALLTILACLSFACSRSPQTAEVTIRLEEPTVSLASATILVDYSQAAATPLTRGGDPACTSIAPNVTTEFADDRQGQLTITADAVGGFSPPIDLAVCRMIPATTSATATAIAARLRISVLNAIDTAGVALDDRQLASSRGTTRRPAAPTADARPNGASPGTIGRTGRTASAAGSSSATSAGKSQATGEQAADSVATDPGSASPRPRTGGMGASPEVGRRLIPSDRTAAARSPGSASSPEAAGREGSDSDSYEDGTDDAALGKADANEDSDTDRSATAYVLTIGVTTQGKLGALQFNLHHHGTSGGFAGAGASARCNRAGAAASAMASFNDVGNGVLRAGFIDLNGFDTPGAVATCTFKSRDSVTASDFSVEVVDATDPELQPQNVTVAVLDLRAQ